ncbi:MAG: hypothetical protein IKJ73_01360 [Lachnospiraceae bacterium]|nr:hypothetical protein [Lachnospiraceae bacterium]
MRLVLKIFLSITKFIWRKIGVAGLLFLVIIFAVPVSFYLYDDNSDEYAYECQYELGQASIVQIERTDMVEAHFSEYELDERYKKKCIYQVTVDVTNVGVNPIYIHREFFRFHVENEDENMESFEVCDYYYEMDEYDRFNTEIIASAKTNKVSFMFAFDEDEVPSSLTFYDEYEGDKIFELDVPTPQ